MTTSLQICGRAESPLRHALFAKECPLIAHGHAVRMMLVRRQSSRRECETPERARADLLVVDAAIDGSDKKEAPVPGVNARDPCDARRR